MPYYRFEVKQPGGQLASGTLSAATMAEAGETLRRQGGTILALAPWHGARRSRGLRLGVLSGPSLKDVLNFTNQLAVMIKAGISLRVAIEGIAEQTISWAEDPDFGYLVAESVPDFDDVELLQPRRLYERQGRLADYGGLVDRLKTERKARLEEFPELSAEIVKAVG